MLGLQAGVERQLASESFLCWVTKVPKVRRTPHIPTHGLLHTVICIKYFHTGLLVKPTISTAAATVMAVGVHLLARRAIVHGQHFLQSTSKGALTGQR